MGALRGLAAAAVLAVLGLLGLLGAVVLGVALLLVLYWDARVLVLSILLALFAAGGALAILVARARARDNARLVALSIVGELAYWALRGVRAIAQL
jgi:hypothetical protein